MNSMNNRIPQGLLSALNGAGSVLICGHVNPDGDAVGSCLALAHGLRAMGKKADVAFEMALPRLLMPLPGAEDVLTPAQAAAGKYDTAMALDVSESGRMGRELAEIYRAVPVRLQADHHGTNPGYAQENWVEGDAAATGVLVLALLQALGAEITPDIADCLYAAIATDTGNFCFENTDYEALTAFAVLKQSGLHLSRWSRHFFLTREKARTRLLGRALTHLEYFADGLCAGMTLTHADFEEACAGREHTEGVVNFGIDSEGVYAAFLLYENPDGSIKCSLRALPPCRIDRVACLFGGGGHALAAGCSFTCTMEEAKTKVEAALLDAVKDLDRK